MKKLNGKKLLISAVLSVAAGVVSALLICGNNTPSLPISVPGIDLSDLSKIKEYVMSSAGSFVLQALIIFASSFTFIPLVLQSAVVFYRALVFTFAVKHVILNGALSAAPFAVYIIQTLILIIACRASYEFSKTPEKRCGASLSALVYSFLMTSGASIIIGITPGILNGMIK